MYFLASFVKCLDSYTSFNPYHMRFCTFSTMGTPDCIAPEVLLKKGYGMECDWFVDRSL
ncbi:hypothetical protein MKW94_008639 [Papaver nudicaule]|uniref:Uncharacterized protein n=1 Tax=Papaver nudicaule TaxID=74823 RepID=A0AA41VA79_PAPNU|nr:hypothetical protein [Papaver nudicaule]